jgi:predicted Zn finger-like uncharacterized protein
MPELITCPECAGKLRIREELLGKKIKCPKCQKQFVAKVEEEEAEPEELEEEEEPVRPASKRRRDEDEDERPRRRDEDEEDRPRRRRRDEEEEDDEEPRLKKADVRAVAWFQKAIILCILANLATIPIRVGLETMGGDAGLLGLIILLVYYLAVAITATVFVFMLAVKIYSSGVGVLLGILTLIPCIGLIVLLIINARATSILKKHGVRVGLLGANSADLP